MSGVKGQTLPAPVASLPSQRSALPVIVEQNPAQVFAVTPLKVKRLVTARFVVVAFVERRVVAVSLERLVEVVAAIRPLLSVARRALVTPVSQVEPESVARVVEEFANVWSADHVLRSERSVEDAAVTVIELPREKLVPLIVPREPLIKPEPIVVVETTRPLESVARSELVSEVNHVDPEFVNWVVLARVLLSRPTTVEDACETNPDVNVARLETPRVDESVVALVTPSVPPKDPLPAVRVPTVPELLYKLVELASVAKKLVEVAFVRVTFPVNVFTPVHEFVSLKSVDDAAEIVIELPRAKLVPLMVPSEPLINPEPIDVVETTRPFSFVASSALERPVSHVEPLFVNAVVVARVALNKPTTVEEACETKPLLNRVVIVVVGVR